MANASKQMVVGSMIVAALVALAAVADLAIGVPFAGRMVMDIMFLIGAAIVIYLGWDSYQDQR